MNSIYKRRLDRLEERQGLDRDSRAVFRLINDPADPDNAERLAGAERFQRDHPNGLLIERFILGTNNSDAGPIQPTP
jgi:hypothetical protein